MDDVVKTALWQFNEAVSLLRSARSALRPGPDAVDLGSEIDESLPVIQAALQGLASHVTKENAS